MSKNARSIDGFIPRRHGDSGAAPVMRNGLQPPSSEPSSAEPRLTPRRVTSTPQPTTGESGLSKQDIDQSLSRIEQTEPAASEASKRRRFRFGRIKNRKKFIKRTVLVIVAIILLIGGNLAVKLFLNSQNIFKGNLFGLIQHKPLKMDANGRSNILLFGTSEDDPGHDAAWLTDSLMVVSLDQKNHNAYTFSIPRDLWVDYKTSDCSTGYKGKINALYQCYSNDGKDEEAGSNALKKTIGEVTGLDIQYYVHINYSVVKDAVDAVGGVDVDIQSDPESVGGVLDRNFDWACNYTCYYVKYENGTHHLDGTHALYLSRARGDNNGQATYGFSRGNFDRELNQQKIAKALMAKAVSAGTLTNFTKVSALLDAFGKNLRTNFDTTEIQTLMDIAKNTPSDAIKSLDIGSSDANVFTTGNEGGQSIVLTTAGLYDYTPVHSYLAKRLSSDAAVREGAKIGVFNGGAADGTAKTVADALESKGLTADAVGNATSDATVQYQIYDMTGGKMTATSAKLASIYGVSVKTNATPPVRSTDGYDFIILVGPSATASAQ